MWCRSGPSRVRPLPFGSLQMLRTARPVQVDMYVRVCVIGFGSWDRLNFRPSCLLRPSAGAAVTGLHHGRRGVAPAPRFQLCVPVAPAVGAVPLCLCLVPQWHRGWCDVSVVCWFDVCTAAWLGDCRSWLG